VYSSTPVETQSIVVEVLVSNGMIESAWTQIAAGQPQINWKSV